MDNGVVPMTMYTAFSEEQRRVLSTLERVGGGLSLFGVLLIFVTFAMFKRIRTVPNTFILFASIANVGASVASLIALDGIMSDTGSPLCQAQGFLFEMFMQSDPWWSFAMAVNVYMVFFLAANPTSFRRHLWIYCLICFGVPAIPAFICLFLRPRGRPIYGDALLWCWIDNDWNSLRIFSYYLPIWVCIALSAVIYALVGYQVFHQRNQLRNLTLSNQAKETSTSDVRDSAEKNLTGHSSAGYYGTVTTEVQVTTTNPCCTAAAATVAAAAAAATASSPPCSPTTVMPAAYHPWSANHAVTELPFDEEQGMSSSSAAIPMSPLSPCSSPHCPAAAAAKHHHHHSRHQLDSSSDSSLSSTRKGSSIATISGAGTSGKGPSVTATTTPAGPHHHHHPNCHSASVVSSSNTQAQRQKRQRRPTLHRMGTSGRRFAAKLRHMDPVKLAYLRTSFVFAISVLVTWTPSSINRVYNLVYPDTVSYGLNIASAAVLPLQGVWNAVIYFSTSWKILRDEFESLCYKSRFLRRLAAGTRLDGSGLAGRGRGPFFPDGVGGENGGGATAAAAVRLGSRSGGGVDPLGEDGLSRVASKQRSPESPRPMLPSRVGSRVSSPRIGTVRVQRGGELDAMAL